jgi:hypothetical protein
MPWAVLVMRTKRFRAISKMGVFSESSRGDKWWAGWTQFVQRMWLGTEAAGGGRSAACDVDPCSSMKAWRINIGESQNRGFKIRWHLFFFLKTSYDSGEEQQLKVVLSPFLFPPEIPRQNVGKQPSPAQSEKRSNFKDQSYNVRRRGSR